MSELQARNPRTGQIDYRFEADDAASVNAAVGKARAAQVAWAESGIARRAEVLHKWAAQLQRDMATIAAALSIDTGRARISHEEVDAIVHMIHGYAEHAEKVFAPVSRASGAPDIDFEQQYVPYPVVGVISPWNFPMVLSFFDALPALMAGCTVVIKPSEVTPRFVEPLMESIRAVPELDGVIQVVRGDGATGQALIAAVDLIVFTGSIPTGLKVAQAAAQRLIPCFLELGGKDPAIVLAGADLDRAATSILRSAVYNTGQVCYAIERVYVDERVHGEFVRLLAGKAAALALNYPDMGHGEIGPFIFDRQAAIVAGQLRDAEAKGARIVTGGAVEEHGGGLYMRATVVDGATHEMELMTEETFGPVVPVMAFGDVDEAVRLANDTRYGLTAAVFGPTPEEATRVAARVNAGAVSINDTDLPRAITLDGEKMAFGMSGIGGSRYGASTMMRYVRKKALIRNHGEVKPLAVLSEEEA